MLRGQEFGDPDPLSDPLDQLQQPERQVDVATPVGQDAFRPRH
jgi:hypothetical protein